MIRLDISITGRDRHKDVSLSGVLLGDVAVIFDNSPAALRSHGGMASPLDSHGPAVRHLAVCFHPDSGFVDFQSVDSPYIFDSTPWLTETAKEFISLGLHGVIMLLVVPSSCAHLFFQSPSCFNRWLNPGG